MKTYMVIIFLSATLILIFSSLKNSCVKSLVVSGLFSSVFFIMLYALKVLSVFKIGFNFFTLALSFLFGIPGIVSILFFDVLSII